MLNVGGVTRCPPKPVADSIPVHRHDTLPSVRLPVSPSVRFSVCPPLLLQGLRALLQKDAGALTRLVAAEQPDVLCLQETKLQAEHVSDAEASSKLLASAGGPFSQAHFNCSTAKKGYSGVAVFCRSPALSVAKGIGAPEHDDEGRVLTVELPDLFVVNVYVPNSGEGLKRLEYRTGSWDVAFAAYIRCVWRPGIRAWTHSVDILLNFFCMMVSVVFSLRLQFMILHLLLRPVGAPSVAVFPTSSCAAPEHGSHPLCVQSYVSTRYLTLCPVVIARHVAVVVAVVLIVVSVVAHYLSRGLEAKKPVIVTGDLNCAHTEIDIHNPKGNLRSAGFTQEERDSFSAQIIGAGYVDTFRRQHPGVVGYTYYSYRFNARANNKGWRLDYCLASAALEPRLHDAFILPTVTGSDHVPLGLVLKAAQ